MWGAEEVTRSQGHATREHALLAPRPHDTRFLASLHFSVIPDTAAGPASLLKQADALLELIESGRVGPSTDSSASLYMGLTLERLALMRGEVAQELERSFAAASAASHQHGHSSKRAQQLWGRFKAKLRQLATLTLLLISQPER